MAYTKTNWQDLPNTTTPINASNLNKMENGIANAVEKTGDTLTGELNFNNKNDYGAIRKTRTIDNVDYGVSIGVGANASARMELYSGGQTQGSIEARTNGIYNGISGNRLAEQSSSAVSLTTGTGTIAANTSYKIGNVVGLNVKVTGVNASTGTTTTLFTLPSGCYNTTTEMEIGIFYGNGSFVPSWIRTNGQVVISPLANLSNAELKIVGSFLV